MLKGFVKHIVPLNGYILYHFSGLCTLNAYHSLTINNCFNKEYRSNFTIGIPSKESSLFFMNIAYYFERAAKGHLNTLETLSKQWLRWRLYTS